MILGKMLILRIKKFNTFNYENKIQKYIFEVNSISNFACNIHMYNVYIT